MQNQEQAVVFDEQRASTYDERAAKIAPLRDTLHLLTRLILSELPTDARILCVGVGTGLELIYLAREFPQWRFTAVDPASAMLDVCRQKAEACGVASRCTWHEGYLDSLPASEPFHAATCLLVSHFFMQQKERRDFFGQIASRLCSQGYLVNADLASDMSSVPYQNLCEIWTRLLEYAGYPDEDVKEFLAAHDRDVAVLPPNEVSSIIASSDFDEPTLFLQTLFIHAWYARRT
ncbi:MAG: class I SAM-dependent methyltransferase [Cyanobacteria bacterium J06597_16]